MKHFNHISKDPIILFADIILLSETWLQPETSLDIFQLPSYTLYTNSWGRGKGLAIYANDKFWHDFDISEPNLQITKVNSNHLEVISVYRSKECSLPLLVEKLLRIFNRDKSTVICGDFNVCLKSSPNNALFQALKQQDFKQLVSKATHLQGGLIDHIYVRQTEHNTTCEVQHYCPYYTATDHDALLLTLKPNEE